MTLEPTIRERLERLALLTEISDGLTRVQEDLAELREELAGADAGGDAAAGAGVRGAAVRFDIRSPEWFRRRHVDDDGGEVR